MLHLNDFPAFLPSIKILEQIKRTAKELNSGNMRHTAALELAAKAEGYRNFRHAQNELKASAQEQLWLYNSVSCEVSQPAGYTFGAWYVEAKLSEQLQKKMFSGRLAFPFPSLPKRIVNAKGGYITDVDGKMGGQFNEGVWIGHLYSNGIEEEKNPTTIEAWRQAFITGVVERLWGKTPE